MDREYVEYVMSNDARAHVAHLREKLAVIEQKLRHIVKDPALWRSDIFAVRMAVSACADQIAALNKL